MSRDTNTTVLLKLETSDSDSLASEVLSLKDQISVGKKLGKQTALLISGSTFGLVQKMEQDMMAVFLKDVLLEADSVILFRSSPKQKADAVKLVKSFFGGKKVTLSIGDGFNDVAMIQEAHVGIGVLGAESNQAAAFADFAIV